MTREEAQIIIGNIPITPETMDDCYSVTEYQIAKAMAIAALENPIIEIDGKKYIAENLKLKTVHGKTGEVVIGGFKEVE